MCVRQSAGKLEIQSRNLKFSQAGVAKKKKEAEEEDGQKKKNPWSGSHLHQKLASMICRGYHPAEDF